MDVLWFTIVTITALGYGDFLPKTWYTRLFAVITSCIGMGLMGTLSTVIAARVLAFGDMDEKIKKLSVDNQQRYLSYKPQLDYCYRVYTI